VVPDSILFRQANVFCDSDVLVIGDSHSLISGAHRAYPGCDVSARAGRDSVEGLKALELGLRPRHRVVVWDLSTNDHADPEGFAARLEQLRERVGERELILVNTWRRDGANSHRSVNAVIDDFVGRYPARTRLVDWAAHVDAHEEALGRETDFVHFSAAAYEDRIELINTAIREALGGIPGEAKLGDPA
jgi:hypothetical protein